MPQEVSRRRSPHGTGFLPPLAKPQAQAGETGELISSLFRPLSRADNPGRSPGVCPMPSSIEDLVKSVRELSAADLERLLLNRQAEDKALRTLWRAALAREREERRQVQEASRAE